MVIANVRSERYDPLKLNELQNIRSESIAKICPSITGSGIAKYGINTMDVQMEGTTPSAQEVRKWEVAEGRFLMLPDIDNNTAVAIVGVNVADELFGKQEDITGRNITLNGVNCKVVGVLEEQGGSMMGSFDDKVIIPFTLAQRLFSAPGIKTFYASAANANTVDEAEKDVRAFLNQRYKNDEDAFNVVNQTSILSAMTTVTGLMTALLGGIAAISLLVGGIGIMNIMLVSVSERTREIGIRKAIGATRSNILTQFLIEALVISLLGGLIGLGLSYGIISILTVVMGMAITMSADIMLLAIGFSLGVGLVFGMYPANKASKLHPIEALRYEG
jgi:putative ABC transport system permease protein